MLHRWFDHLQQVDNIYMTRSAVRDHPPLRTTLWSFAGTPYRELSLHNYRTLQLFPPDFPHKIVMDHLSFRKLCVRCVPKQLTLELKAKCMVSALIFLQRYHDDDVEFRIRSSQLMIRWLHTLSQKPSSSQCIGIIVDLPERRNSSRFCRA